MGGPREPACGVHGRHSALSQLLDSRPEEQGQCLPCCSSYSSHLHFFFLPPFSTLLIPKFCPEIFKKTVCWIWFKPAKAMAGGRFPQFDLIRPTSDSCHGDIARPAVLKHTRGHTLVAKTVRTDKTHVTGQRTHELRRPQKPASLILYRTVFPHGNTADCTHAQQWAPHNPPPRSRVLICGLNSCRGAVKL